MNSIQQKTFELLTEVDNICQDNNIIYYLNARTTAMAIIGKGFINNDSRVGVLMTPNNVKKFISIIENGNYKHRSIEYMCNYKKHLGFNVNYVNDDTTYYDLRRGYDFSHNGIRITINIIRQDKPDVALATIEHGLEVGGYRLTRTINLSTMICFCIATGLKIFGRKRLNNFYFNRACKKYSTTKHSRTFIRPFKQRKKYLDDGIFDEHTRIEFENSNFNAPLRTNDFLINYYGANWKEIICNSNFNNERIVKITDMPYKDFQEAIKEFDIDINHVMQEQRKSFTDAIFSYKYMHNKKMSWIIAKRSGDRLDIYEKLMAKRELIYNLLSNKSYDELDVIFAENEQCIRHYYKYGLGFCVCKEFFDIQCDLLERRGQYKFVKKIKKIIPKEHLKPIVEK